MPYRLVIHIPRWVIKGTFYFILLILALFFAFTRTQRGRDILRDQLTFWFNQKYAGQIEIGEIRGNIIGAIYLSDLTLYDPQNQPVLRTDSASIQPDWLSLFLQRTLALNHIHLFNPTITLRRDSTTWNIQEALRPRHPSTDTSFTPSISVADIQLHRATLITQNTHSSPEWVEKQYIFDFTNARWDSIQFQGWFEWRPERKFIDILHFSSYLTPVDIQIQDLQMQIIADTAGIHLTRSVVQLDTSQWALNGKVKISNGPLPTHLRLQLSAAVLSPYEMSRLFPRYPFQAPLSSYFQIEGPPSALQIKELSLASGSSTLSTRGFASFTPSAFQLQITSDSSLLYLSDITQLVPHTAQVLATHNDAGGVATTFTTALVYDTSATFHLSTYLALSSHSGELTVNAELTRALNSPLTYKLSAHFQQWNPDPFLAYSLPATRLTGTLQLEGTGITAETARVTLASTLNQSMVYHRPFKHIQLYAYHSPQTTQTTGTLTQDVGKLSFRGSIWQHPDYPQYSLHLKAQQVNLAPLLLSDTLYSALTGTLHLQAQGRWPHHFTGQLSLNMDSSQIGFKSYPRTIPPFSTQIQLTETQETPTLRISGDILEASVTGDYTWQSLTQMGTLWTSVARYMANQIKQKRLHAATYTHTDSLLQVIQAQHALTTPETALQLQTALTIKRPDILSALIPTFPVVYGAPLSWNTHLQLFPDLAAIQSTLHIDSLKIPNTYLHHASIQSVFQTQLNEEMQPSTVASIDLSVDSLRYHNQQITDASFSFQYQHQKGSLKLSLPRIGTQSALNTQASLTQYADRYRLTIHQFLLKVDTLTWTQADTSAIDFFADAILLHHLQFVQQPVPNASSLKPQITLNGTLSTVPKDTAYFQAQDLPLHIFSQLIGGKQTIDGRLDAYLQLASALRSPTILGETHITQLSFDNRDLGDLAFTSTYTPETASIQLSLTLQQPRPISKNVLRNTLTVQGYFRPYRRTPEGHMEDPGFLDLQVDIESADLFFMEYIFPDLITDVQGFTTGRGHIGGTFSYPIFQAALFIPEAQFKIPLFKLQYAVEGLVTVDSTGFHLNQVKVHDPGPGVAEINGDILFNRYQYFSLNLQGALEALQIMNVSQSFQLPFYGHIRASGQATLTGPIYQAHLRSPDARLTPESEVFIPVLADDLSREKGFIVFVDASGKPLSQRPAIRRNLLAPRPPSERSFLEGLEMTLNIQAPQGVTAHLVFDPLLGDMISAIGSGRVQLERKDQEFFLFGELVISEGEYLFTAGEVFIRKFILDPGGRIIWDGPPLNPRLELQASYRTWASLAGLPGQDPDQRIPVIVRLHISDRLHTPNFRLSLALDRGRLPNLSLLQSLERLLNQPDRVTEYAVSVLLTNTFLLTTDALDVSIGQSVNELAFNSLSQLIATLLNRFVNQVFSNVDINLGLQQGNNLRDLALTYGIVLRLLNERLIIRGQGIFQTQPDQPLAEELQGEFVVELRLSDNISLEVFYRREAEFAGYTSAPGALYGAYGTRIIFQRTFTSWPALFRRIETPSITQKTD